MVYGVFTSIVGGKKNEDMTSGLRKDSGTLHKRPPKMQQQVVLNEGWSLEESTLTSLHSMVSAKCAFS